MPHHAPQLLLIAPVYNEETVLPESCHRLVELLSELIKENLIHPNSGIVLVNDGSKDQSWKVIQELVRTSEYIQGMNLSRNFGQQSATLAGLLEFEAEIYISIDIDLQDDISKIKDMVQEYKNGNHIVYGVKNDRSTDGLIKRWSANIYYKLMKILGLPLVPQHSEFRLMSHLVIEKLKEYPERNFFLRGLITNIGLQSSKVFYKRQKRVQGTSKYSLSKLLKLALDGIFDFSTTPLKAIILGAWGFFLISIGIFIYIFISYFNGHSASGWVSILASLYLIGGGIMFSLAILAEYIAKIYLETKGRPRYIVETKIHHNSKMD